MEYNPGKIEKKWQKFWEENRTYKINDKDTHKPKFYILDMFPYPSGAGLHVGHPLGYIASDIFSRYKRMCGFNVLHPMGFDAFGLPAEQYAVETGQHPAKTTDVNIKRYKEQLKSIGFDYDWSREIRTSDPKYYKWTQWIFIQLFNHYYDVEKQKAVSIDKLIAHFDQNGSKNHTAFTDKKATIFSAAEWKSFGEKEKSEILMQYRIAYQTYADVNWCPQLGTVLANDEVKEGLSVRGGFPVEKKSMRQWFLRITAYAERLIADMEMLDWSDSLKEMQKNWIGKSQGATVYFEIEGFTEKIEIFTTRPDTIFGATFMVLAPEHPLVQKIMSKDAAPEIKKYIKEVKNKSERERMSEVKKVSGVFTGAYAKHPFSGEKIPVWIADYVLMGYGSGAIMAVPSDDQRDRLFAEKFNIPIIEVVDQSEYKSAEIGDKVGRMKNSDFLNGLEVVEAIEKIISKIESENIGNRTTNYRLRDAGFSRQRYWGEPFPVFYKNGIPQLLKESDLPLELPEVKSYKPSGSGQSPLAALNSWVEIDEKTIRETDTMPGFAGSSWYFLRYMDPHNNEEFANKKKVDYWQDVDLYIGGAEHAVGHLMYARFWNKFLYDIEKVSVKEPFKKLINQGMIQGRSNLIFKRKKANVFISADVLEDYLKENNLTEEDVISFNIDINLTENDFLNIKAFEKNRPEYEGSKFIKNSDNLFKCTVLIEKMSKSLYNVVNPDDIIEEYGADVFRMYEMFLGPIEMHKPWNTNGIDGVAKFMKRFYKLFYNDEGKFVVTDEKADEQELKILHKTIKKVRLDIENFSFNTAVSAFMVLTNELTKMNCHKREILENFVLTLAPFAPHICEELWSELGNKTTVIHEKIPQHDEKYLKEDAFEYPVSINGKMRLKLTFEIGVKKEVVEKEVMAHEIVKKWVGEKNPKKIIFVPGKIINIVV
ncbi:MAG: leucine--tRNA ligase [Chitinophagaceae bacterium]|nr:MAG: leucine--tRNA ligase [Chitinophagaceae bacterium]